MEQLASTSSELKKKQQMSPLEVLYQIFQVFTFLILYYTTLLSIHAKRHSVKFFI